MFVTQGSLPGQFMFELQQLPVGGTGGGDIKIRRAVTVIPLSKNLKSEEHLTVMVFRLNSPSLKYIWLNLWEQFNKELHL